MRHRTFGTFSTSGKRKPTAAHIHRGAKGANGPIKITLFEDPDDLTVSTVDGCVKKISKRIAKKLRKGPKDV